MILYSMVESKTEKATDFMTFVFFSVTYLKNRKHDARLGGPYPVCFFLWYYFFTLVTHCYIISFDEKRAAAQLIVCILIQYIFFMNL